MKQVNATSCLNRGSNRHFQSRVYRNPFGFEFQPYLMAVTCEFSSRTPPSILKLSRTLFIKMVSNGAAKFFLSRVCIKISVIPNRAFILHSNHASRLSIQLSIAFILNSPFLNWLRCTVIDPKRKLLTTWRKAIFNILPVANAS